MKDRASHCTQLLTPSSRVNVDTGRRPRPAGRCARAVGGLVGCAVLFVQPTAYAQPNGDPASPGSTTDLAWIHTGGPPGGLGYDIRYKFGEPDTWFVTDALAGVFKSTDNGRSWFACNDGITIRIGFSADQIPIFCLTVDPHSADTMWAGTKDKRGIFQSTDGGAHWQERDQGVPWDNGITFRGFTVHPESPDIVYAAAELSSWIWAGSLRMGRDFEMTQGVVFRTTNGGQDWQEIWRGDNLARYIWIDPRDPDVLYVSTGIFDREAANSIPASQSPGGVGVVKTIDGGQTWTESNNGLQNLYVGTLFMHPQNPDILLAGTGANPYRQGSGVYITLDGAASWEQVVDSGGHAITAVEYAVSNPDIAYAGSQDAIYRSEDGGLHWERVSGPQHGWGTPNWQAHFPIDLQADPRNPNRLFANNYGGGNLLSEDGGQTWSLASDGYTGAEMRDLAVAADAPGRVFAAGRTGLFLSSEGGFNWHSQHYGVGEWMVVALDPADSQHVLAAHTTDPTMFGSNNHGTDWVRLGPTLDDGIAWRAIAFAPSNPTIVYAGTGGYFFTSLFDDSMAGDGIYVSSDRGDDWTSANNSVSSDANVAALAVDFASPLVVYAATTNRGMLKSADGGQTWITVNHDLPGNPPGALAVAVHPTQPGVVYAGLDSAGLHRSTDGGSSWKYVTGGLSAEALISDIVFDPSDPMTLYTSDRLSGVYQSTDGGETWSTINDGLSIRDVKALALSADGEHLYAATEGAGVFRLDLNGQPPPALDDEEPGEPEEPGENDGEGEPEGDGEPESPPHAAVVETAPVDGAIDVPLDAHLIIRFDRSAAPDSLNAGVAPGVEFEPDWSDGATTLTLLPATPLVPGITYEVTIVALQFTDGAELVEPFSFRFTTTDSGNDSETTGTGRRRSGFCGLGTITAFLCLPVLAVCKARRKLRS